MVLQKLGDSEKILMMFEAAESIDLKIEDEYVSTYVYLLKQRGLDFSYSFIFHPLPYSDRLDNDLLGLKMAGYLKSGSVIITTKGKNFVESIKTRFDNVYQEILQNTTTFETLDRPSLFKAVYAIIV